MTISAGAAGTRSSVLRPLVAADHSATSVRFNIATSRSRGGTNAASRRAVPPWISWTCSSIAIFSASLLAGQRPTIFGDGEQTRDFVFVDDVCDAFVRAADKGGGLTINIGTGSEASVQRLFDTMARETGFTEPARYAPPRAGELRRSALDPSRAEIHLGWKPWTDLDVGLRRTIDAFRSRT